MLNLGAKKQDKRYKEQVFRRDEMASRNLR
jgi:hypothetical protein